MRKVVNALIILAVTLNTFALVGCNKKEQSSGSSISEAQVENTTTNVDDLSNSKSGLIENIDTIVLNNDFHKKTDREQQDIVQGVLNQYVNSKVIKAGTISYDTKTRTFNFSYVDESSGFYSLNNIKYAVNNKDNLVWNGQEPIVTEPPSGNSGSENPVTGGNTSDNGESNTGNSNTSNSTYIIGIKLNYNNATGFIQGRFITSNGGAYAFDFTDRFTMMDLDLIGQLTNIIETRTCTYSIDAQTLNELIQLSNSIDYTADLYQTVGDTQQDIISEIIYTYNRKTGLLVECCASGVKESTLNDPDADDFAVALLDAIDNKVQRINK